MMVLCVNGDRNGIVGKIGCGWWVYRIYNKGMSCQGIPRQIQHKLTVQHVEILEQDIKALRERQRNMRKINQQLSKLFELIQSQVQQLRGKLILSEGNSNELLSTIESLQRNNKALQSRIQQISEEKHLLSRDSQTQSLKIQIEKGKLRQEIILLKQELQGLRNKQKVSDDLLQRQQAVKLREMEVVMVVSTFERRLKDQQQFNKQTVKKYEQQMSRMQSRCEQLHQKKMQKDSQIAELTSQLKQVRLENELLVKKIASFQSNLQQQYNKLKTKYTQQLQAMRKQNEQLRQQVKAKQIENKMSSQQSKKILLNQRAKNIVLKEAVNKAKNSYQQKSTIIIKQLLAKDQQISNLKRNLSKSRQKTTQNLRESAGVANSETKGLRLNNDGSESDTFSTVHSSLVLDNHNHHSHRDGMKSSKEMFRSRQNRQIEVTIQKNPQRFK